MQDPHTNILVLAGDGGTAFGDKENADILDGFESCGARATLITHDDNGSTIKNIEKNIQSMLENKKPITIFVQAHGSVKNDLHVLYLGKQEPPLPARDLFAGIARGSGGKPVDVFLTSCQGGAALADADFLPEGSCVAALASPEENVSESDVDRFPDALSDVCNAIVSENGSVRSSDLSARKLLDVYLSKALKSRVSPMFAISKGIAYNFYAYFTEQLGKEFSEIQRDRAHAELTHMMYPQQINDIMRSIADARNELDIPATDYGPALAVVKAIKTPQPGKESKPDFPPISEENTRAENSQNMDNTDYTTLPSAAALGTLTAYALASQAPSDHWLRKTVLNHPLKKAAAEIYGFVSETMQLSFTARAKKENTVVRRSSRGKR